MMSAEIRIWGGFIKALFLAWMLGFLCLGFGPKPRWLF